MRIFYFDLDSTPSSFETPDVSEGRPVSQSIRRDKEEEVDKPWNIEEKPVESTVEQGTYYLYSVWQEK